MMDIVYQKPVYSKKFIKYSVKIILIEKNKYFHTFYRIQTCARL